MGTRGFSLGVKRPGPEANHSPSSNAKVRMRGAIPTLPHYSSMAWYSVKKKSTGTTLRFNITDCVPVRNIEILKFEGG